MSDFEECVDFIENYFYVITPSKRKTKITLSPDQRLVLEKIINNKHVLAHKKRMVGFTTILTAYALWLAVKHSDKQICFVSRNRATAQFLAKTFVYSFNRLPDKVRKFPKIKKSFIQFVDFPNESSVAWRTQGDGISHGRNIDVLIVDEYSFVENFDDVIVSLFPCLGSDGKMILSRTIADHDRKIIAPDSILEIESAFLKDSNLQLAYMDTEGVHK